MLASVRYEYGPPSVLRLEEVDTPVPGPEEVLVKVRAASANLGDWELLRGDPPFIAMMACVSVPMGSWINSSPGSTRARSRCVARTDRGHIVVLRFKSSARAFRV
jgi:hypothetical protein